MKLYIVIAFEPEDGSWVCQGGPYVACSDTCQGEAACSASEHAHETGHKTRIITVEV